MSEQKQADVQELVQELAQCEDAQTLQDTARSMGKDLSESDARGLFDLLGTASSNQLFTSLLSGNQSAGGLNLGTLLNYASGQTQQTQTQSTNPLADGFQLSDIVTFMQGTKPQQSQGLSVSNLLSGLLGGSSSEQNSSASLIKLLPILISIMKILK